MTSTLAPEGTFICEIAVLGDILLFGTDTADFNDELWRTDGSPAGTSVLIDLNLFGNRVATQHPYELTVFNGMLSFAGDNGDGSGPGL